jgi:hypothetical protein
MEPYKRSSNGISGPRARVGGPFSAFAGVSKDNPVAHRRGPSSGTGSKIVARMTADLANLYRAVNPQGFRYLPSMNPKRVLTKPSEPVEHFNKFIHNFFFLF